MDLLLKYMNIYFQDLFDLSNKQTSSGEEKITQGGRVCANYILLFTSTHDKGFEPPSSPN